MGALANHLHNFTAFWAKLSRGGEPLTLQEALPRLVPKVRPRFQYEALAMGGLAPVFRPLAGPAAFSLVVDDAQWEWDVGARDLEIWGADFDVLLQRARSNLLKRGGEEHFREVRRGLYRSTWEDNLDGSRVLLPGILKRLPLRGDPVVVLPNRDALLVAGSEDPQGLELLLEAALGYLREDLRFLNGCPLQLRNFQWEPWAATPGQPAEAVLASLQRRRLVEEYARQKVLLDRLHGHAGRAVAVAPYHLAKGPSGKVLGHTIWPQGGKEGWLPEADRVGLAPDGQGQPSLWLPWAQVRERFGHRVEPLGLFPERYRVMGDCPSPG